ncbi:MAG: hypothetical protein BJ554DRAFT_4210, partial [Olpidium bornovanus]
RRRRASRPVPRKLNDPPGGDIGSQPVDGGRHVRPVPGPDGEPAHQAGLVLREVLRCRPGVRGDHRASPEVEFQPHVSSLSPPAGSCRLGRAVAVVFGATPSPRITREREAPLGSVDLSHNQLGDLGLVSIAYSLLTNRALKSLALANNTIVDAPPVPPAVAPAAAAPFQWTVPGSLLVEVPPFAEPGPSADPTAVPSQSQSPPPPQPPPDESRKEGRPGAPGIVSYTMECDGDHAEVPGGAGALAGPPAAPATPGTAPPPRKQQQQQQQALPPPKPLDGSPLELLAQAIADNTVIYLVDLRGNHFGVRGAQAVLPAVKARGKTLAVWVSERIPNEIFTAIQDGNRKVFETAKKGNKGKKKGKGKGK